MRINLNIPDELVKIIDKKAKDLNINRTAFVVMSLSQYFQQGDAMDSIYKMLELMQEQDKPTE